MKIVLSILFSVFTSAYLNAQVQWQPGPGWQVPEIADCSFGDIAMAIYLPQPHIRFCPVLTEQLNQSFPGAGHFYYVHEYGHIVGNTSEPDADRFAASQLAALPGSHYFINAMLRHLYHRAQMGEPFHPRYGTPAQRAERIVYAALNANSNLRVNELGLLY